MATQSTTSVQGAVVARVAIVGGDVFTDGQLQQPEASLHRH
jgi:hypothetical protein